LRDVLSLIAQVIELKDHGIRLAAIDARVVFEIRPQSAVVLSVDAFVARVNLGVVAFFVATVIVAIALSTSPLPPIARR
jgi:hypothetical protein